MSNYFQALVQNQQQYVIPVCNLLPYNDGSSYPGGIRGNVAGTNTLPTTGLVIPDYVKKLDIDYISFSASPESSTQLPANVVGCYIVYDTGYGAGTVFNVIQQSTESLLELADPTEYKVEIRVPVSELIPIDIKCIKRIDPSPSAANTNYIAAPSNITLWKRFFTSTSDNKNILTTNSLPQGPNGVV